MSGDIYYDNVSLLLHCDGTDGSTTFTDSSPSPQTVTSYGDAHVETDQSKFGGASASFDGSGDYLTVSRDAFTFSGDFTIECWVYLNSTSAYVPILDGRTSASYSDFVFGLYPTSVDFVTVAGRLTATDTISLSAWHHIAVTRSSGVIRLFTDGVVNASTWSYAGAITPVSTRSTSTRRRSRPTAARSATSGTPSTALGWSGSSPTRSSGSAATTRRSRTREPRSSTSATTIPAKRAGCGAPSPCSSSSSW